jgi:hypothetical protein
MSDRLPDASYSGLAGQRQAQVVPRLQPVGEDEAQQQRGERGHHEPCERFGEHPADRSRVAQCAMPTTSVENTSGPMSIFISRRKTSEKMEM